MECPLFGVKIMLPKRFGTYRVVVAVRNLEVRDSHFSEVANVVTGMGFVIRDWRVCLLL